MSKGRIVSNLTTWEVGQDLISVADLISEKDGEIRNSGFIEQSDALRKARELISEVFDKHHLDSHGFGLSNSKQTWLSRYKSLEGRAIARRAWDECASHFDNLEELIAEARAEAFKIASDQCNEWAQIAWQNGNPSVQGYTHARDYFHLLATGEASRVRAQGEEA